MTDAQQHILSELKKKVGTTHEADVAFTVQALTDTNHGATLQDTFSAIVDLERYGEVFRIGGPGNNPEDLVHLKGVRLFIVINGEPTEIRPSGPAGGGPWRWISVPPGPSEVILWYRPPLLGISLAMAAGGLLLAALAAAFAARRAKAGLPAEE